MTHEILLYRIPVSLCIPLTSSGMEARHRSLQQVSLRMMCHIVVVLKVMITGTINLPVDR